MKKYLALAEYGSFIKMLITDDKDSMTLIKDVEDAVTKAQIPYEQFNVPTGECTVYREDGMWICVTDNIVVEVLDTETIVEVYYDFASDPNMNFKDFVYLTLCYILGYIIIRDEKIYKDITMPYIAKDIFNEGRTAIRIDRYNEFVENESKYVKVDNHISIDDIMFASNMSSYIETDSIITTSVIDITDLNNVFKVKDMFFID